MIYIDSNIFIYSLLYDNTVPNADKARKILSDIHYGTLKAVTCCLTWDEIVHVIKRNAGSNNAFYAGKYFLEFPNLKILPVDPDTIESAQALVEQYNIQPRDAIHAVSALQRGISDFLTDDQDFEKIQELNRISFDDWEESRSM
ncbi:MAG: type II toxin-antitoxin system VapC family toxin [Methanoregula sp.]|jgi:hypothetical protein